MEKFCAVAVGCLLAGSPIAIAGESLDTATLLCKASVNGQLLTVNLTVDYGRKVVSGNPASFTDTMIVWSATENGRVEHHELNRLSGTYRSWPEGVVLALPPTFSCEKAPLPKF